MRSCVQGGVSHVFKKDGWWTHIFEDSRSRIMISSLQDEYGWNHVFNVKISWIRIMFSI